MKSNWLTKTMALLAETDLSVSEIAAGANVGSRWLYSLMNGRWSDPGIKKVQRVHDFLVSHQSVKGSAEEQAA